jgi:hypothetical protein
MMVSGEKRRYRCCGKMFVPDRRIGVRQKTCSAACRKVQKRESNKRYREDNPDYWLFDRVQAQMKAREFGGCNGIRTEYLLSGKIVCMRCGHKFQGRKSKNNQGRVYHYYMDSGYMSYRICGMPRNTQSTLP